MSSLHRDSTNSPIDSIYRQFPFFTTTSEEYATDETDPPPKKKKKNNNLERWCVSTFCSSPYKHKDHHTNMHKATYFTYLSYLQKYANSYLQTQDPKLNRTLPPHGSGSLLDPHGT